MISKLTIFTTALLLSNAAAQADVSISNKPTQNMSCNAGVCAATAKNAVLNVGDLQTMLANGDTAVKTGSGTKDIDIDRPLSWTSTSRLTLDAQQSVVVKKPVTITGTGALTITTDDGGSGGDLMFLDNGKITFWDLASSLIVEGNSYTLAADVKTLASDIVQNPTGYYALAADYDASADGTFGSINAPFYGVLEGLGNSISNLHIQGVAGLTGFFETLSNATVRDLGFPDAQVQGRSSVGTIAGEAVSATNIIGCWSTGSVKGKLAVGGLVGSLIGNSDISYPTIQRSHSSANVTGNKLVGGMVGEMLGAKIEASYASGSITAKAKKGAVVGGLVGDMQSPGSSVTDSYATGKVEVPNTDIQENGSSMQPHPAKAGGLIGSNNASSMFTSYSTGAVSSTGFAGGSVGYDIPEHILNLYWDLDTSGVSDPSKGAGNIPNDPGLTGLSDTQLRSGLPKGFEPNIWGSNPDINNGYPYLLANPPPKRGQ